jgi:hypothetical protein
MVSQASLRRIWHEVVACPQCKQPHVFPVLVRVRAAPVAEVPLFGGAPAARTIAFTCPNTREIISVPVPDPPDSEIIGPDDPNRPAPEFVPAGATAPGPEEQEYTDWIKASRATAVDFCKTMLTAATGAIPVYFAVLKYLGAEAANASWFSRIGALPPVLFLVAAVVFALALRPRFALVAQATFAEFRASRLRQLNTFLFAGLAVFAAAILLAIALAVGALGG